MTKKNADELRVDKLIHLAKVEVADFEALLYRFEPNISILGRSKSTFENYARHVSAIALHYGQIPTLLHKDQIHQSVDREYLFMIQKWSQTPAQT